MRAAHQLALPRAVAEHPQPLSDRRLSVAVKADSHLRMRHLHRRYVDQIPSNSSFCPARHLIDAVARRMPVGGKGGDARRKLAVAVEWLKVPGRLIRLDRRPGSFEVAFIFRVGPFQLVGAQPEVRVRLAARTTALGNTALPSCVRPPR